jgi:hypothetical protein
MLFQVLRRSQSNARSLRRAKWPTEKILQLRECNATRETITEFRQNFPAIA